MAQEQSGSPLFLQYSRRVEDDGEWGRGLPAAAQRHVGFLRPLRASLVTCFNVECGAGGHPGKASRPRVSASEFRRRRLKSGWPDAVIIDVRERDLGKKKQPGIENESATAMFISMVIRNAIEDFHARHLSDAQMSELNRIIRNAVFTALHAVGQARRSEGARAFVQFHRACIPDYWEKPELLYDYIQTLRLKGKTPEDG